MSRFTPHTPDIAGLEWFPTRRLPRAFNVGGSGIGVLMASTATETIDTLAPYMVSGVPATNVGCDIYDAGSYVAPVVGGLDVPTAAGANTAGWQQTTDDGATWVGLSSAFNKVAVAALDFYTTASYNLLINGPGDYLRYRPTVAGQVQGTITFQGAGSYQKITDGTSGNSPASSRVGWIEVNVVARYAVGKTAMVDGVIGTALDGVNHTSDTGPVRMTAAWKRYTFAFYWNPSTGNQWYNSDVAEFISGGDNTFGVRIRGGTSTDVQVGSVNIVFRSLAELRVATGYAASPAGPLEGVGVLPLLDPDTGATTGWSKANGQNYLFVFYLTGSGGNASLVGCDQASLAENPGAFLEGWLGIDEAFVPRTAVPSAAYAGLPWAPAMWMIRSDTATSVDGQPFSIPAVFAVADTDGQDSDGIATHASDVYGQASVVIGMFDAAGALSVPNDVLTVQIRRTSDDVQMGGDITIDPSEVPQDGRYHLLTRHFASSATLVAATAYYLSFSTASTVPWHVAVAYTTGPPAADAWVENAQAATWDGVGPGGAFNVLANISTVPPALTGFAGTVEQITPDPQPGCAPTSIEYASFAWDASSLGADFGYYELQRLGEDGSTWETIGRNTDEAVTLFFDYEGRRNIEECYRVRVVRADGAESDWSDEICLTCTTALGGDLVLGSNASFGVPLAYGEDGNSTPMHSYARANASSTVVHLIAGRQAPVAFRPLIEGDSDIFTRTLIIAIDVTGRPLAATDPGGLDRFPFDPLIVLIEDGSLPYVALLDGHGRRWFTFPEFVTGSYTPLGHQHSAQVKFTEVSIAPAVIVDQGT